MPGSPLSVVSFPNNSGVFYAGAGAVVYKSTDYGINWVATGSISGFSIKSLAIAIRDVPDYLPSILWAGDDDLGRKLAAGIYFVQLKANEFNKIEKVILLR